MASLSVEHNQLNYVGVFSKPAFELWGKGEKILKGLFSSFEPYGINLSNIRNNTASLDPSDQEITVNLSGLIYRFKFDRVECIRTDATEEEFSTFPQLLNNGDKWLRSELPQFSFSSHLFTYLAHTSVQGSTSHRVLAPLSTVELPELGVSRGSGMIYRSDLAEKEWELQLTLDHSLLVPDGLFIQFSILSKADHQDYLNAFQEGRDLLKTTLKNVGVEISE